MDRRGLFERALAILLLLAFWQALSLKFSGGLVVASPWDALMSLRAMAGTGAFWQRLTLSSARVGLGFLLSLLLAAGMAVLSFYSPLGEALLAPFISLMKSVPVAIIVILLLILFSSSGLATAVVLLLALPIFYTAILTGARSADPKLLEMARVFRWGEGRKWLWIRLPAMRGHLRSALRVASGMAWKAGVSAEVIGMPGGSIGEAVYSAKIYLATEELFAWCAVILGLSWVMERLCLLALDALYAALWRAGR